MARRRRQQKRKRYVKGRKTNGHKGIKIPTIRLKGTYQGGGLTLHNWWK